jgi:hypothetical protein
MSIKLYSADMYVHDLGRANPAVLSGAHGGTRNGRGGRQIMAPFFTRGGGGRGSVGSSDVRHDEPTTDATTGRRTRAIHSNYHPERSTT